METLLAPASVAHTLFHSRAGGFPLPFSYVLLDADGNDVRALDRVIVVRVTALNGERFRLRDHKDIRRFLTAVGRLRREEVPS
jgi:hypothetical protein